PGTAGRDALEEDGLHAGPGPFLGRMQRLFFVLAAGVGVDVDGVGQVVHGGLVGTHAVARFVGSDDSPAHHGRLLPGSWVGVAHHGYRGRAAPVKALGRDAWSDALSSRAMTAVPLIDLSPACHGDAVDRLRVARAIDAA